MSTPDRSEIMRRYHRQHPEAAVATATRMRRQNPMYRASVRRKVSATLRRIGHGPTVRGGNGTGPTKAELVLMRMLGRGAVLNYAVPLGRRSRGYPTHYKVAVALPDLRLAVEADGKSHLEYGRRPADARKDRRLTLLGWTVLRFTNREILEDRFAVGVELGMAIRAARRRRRAG